MTTPSAHSQFLLLLRQPNDGPGPTPEELREIMGHFGKWMAELSAKGALIGTNSLEDTGRVLRSRRGATITDGPFAETKEIVGGYILIAARSLDEAAEIASGCPGLDYRLSVEVRPVKTERDE